MSVIGSHLGPDAIVSPLGADGMGEVYRTTDTKLGREVALKILPVLFTNSAHRRSQDASPIISAA